jgi:hypothetical protein
VCARVRVFVCVCLCEGGDRINVFQGRVWWQDVGKCYFTSATVIRQRLEVHSPASVAYLRQQSNAG